MYESWTNNQLKERAKSLDDITEEQKFALSIELAARRTAEILAEKRPLGASEVLRYHLTEEMVRKANETTLKPKEAKPLKRQ